MQPSSYIGILPTQSLLVSFEIQLCCCVIRADPWLVHVAASITIEPRRSNELRALSLDLLLHDSFPRSAFPYISPNCTTCTIPFARDSLVGFLASHMQSHQQTRENADPCQGLSARNAETFRATISERRRRSRANRQSALTSHHRRSVGKMVRTAKGPAFSERCVV